MVSDQRFAFSFVEENTHFLFGQQNISLKNSDTGNVNETEAIWFPSSIIYPAYQVEQWSSHTSIKEKIGLMCEILIFSSTELSSSLEASNLLWFCEFMSTMINYPRKLQIKKWKVPLDKMSF